MTSPRNLLFHLPCPSQSSSRSPDVWTDFGPCLTCTVSVLIGPVEIWMQQWGEDAGGSRASCVFACSAVNPMRKSTPSFQLVHPSMSCYSVSLSDISGTKSNMLKITISHHLLFMNLYYSEQQLLADSVTGNGKSVIGSNSGQDLNKNESIWCQQVKVAALSVMTLQVLSCPVQTVITFKQGFQKD